ncbi:MAG: hypothetical protein JXQ87_06505 [Bacteroidia bacterium]
MLVQKIITILATTLLIAANVNAQELDYKSDVYNHDKIFVYNESGNAIGFYFKTLTFGDHAIIYDFNGNAINQIKLVENKNEPNMWLDEKTAVPSKIKKRIEPEEKVL